MAGLGASLFLEEDSWAALGHGIHSRFIAEETGLGLLPGFPFLSTQPLSQQAQNRPSKFQVLLVMSAMTVAAPLLFPLPPSLPLQPFICEVC